MELIGEGGQGTVYKTWDQRLDRWVAVKTLHSLKSKDTETWVKEVKESFSFDHPHIAALYDIGDNQGQPFVVTEYLAGGTLKAHVQSLRSVGDRLAFEDIHRYALQICDALIHAHRHRVCHRNLKTENVMFTETGVLKLTDFDLNSPAEPQAGEQFDIFCFGILLYEMATGELPFPVLREAALAADLASFHIPPLERLRTDLPEGFAPIIVRALERDHYRDIHALARDLRMLGRQSAVESQETKVKDVSASPSTNPTLKPGRLLSGRFRIIRFIARGGMGEVYEAEDLELREHVALKTVRAELVRQDRVMQRFKREIHLARKVTHSNVCRIYDVFNHTEPPDGTGQPQAKITFLSMELLRGETLADRLQRTGPMQTAEVLPIITQMASALNAAHKAGIIHRDFKTSNVMLVPSDDEEHGSRVVVTDFGLAHSSAAPEGLATALPGTVEVVGTPEYMAPEQLEGGEITAATDIYALGIVLYEMLTARLPFDGDSGFAVALKRLTKPAPSPRVFVPDLDGRWEQSVLRCLERNPTARFSGVTEVVQSLSGDSVVSAQPAAQSRRRWLGGRGRTAALVGTILLLGVLIGMLAVWFSPQQGQSRRSVAVLGFRNLTEDADTAWLSTALAEMLTTELSAGAKLRTIPGENVARMKVELSLPETGSLAPDTLTRIRNYLGADVVILGSYLVNNGNPNKVRVDFRLQDSTNGELLATISDEAYPTEILELVSRSGAALREKLGVELAANEAELAHASQPANTEAARFYAEGLEKLRMFDAFSAKSLLEKAVAADPRHALARSALAASWSMLGYGNKAKEEAKNAVDLAANLSRENRLLVEGRYSETALDWDQAVEVYRTLFGFFPDNLDYGLRLAAAQTSAGKPQDAIATVTMLRKLPTLDGNSPAIDLAEARAAGAMSDFKRQLTLSETAAGKGRTSGVKLLVAGARLLQGTAFANLGSLEEARAAFDDARQMYAAAGDRWDAANSAINLAYVLAKAGDMTGARNIHQESLTIYNELGDRRGTAAALVSMASLYRSQADLAGARRLHEQALAIYRELGDRVGEAKSLNNIANVLAVAGDLQGAAKMYEAALPIFRETRDRNGAATVLGNLADLAAESGDISGAAAFHEESLATFRELDNKSAVAFTLSRLADLHLIQGDLAASRKKHEEALALRTHIGEKGSVADNQVALAQIAFQEGFPARAETPAREAIEQFRAEGRTDDEASATAVLARSLLAQGKYADARASNVRAEELSAKSNNGALRLSIAITTASIQAFGGDTARATNSLNAIAAEARKFGLIALELEARLALGQIEVAAGNLDAGRSRLATVQRNAKARGYMHIANRAAEAMKRY